MFRRPENPNLPTKHLYIANTGPCVGVVPDKIRLELSATTNVTSVTVLNPNLPSVYVSCLDEDSAVLIKKIYDRRNEGHRTLCGRHVVIEFADVHMPIAAFEPSDKSKILNKPEDLIRHIKETWISTPEDAGNLPDQIVATEKPTLVSCPLCSGNNNRFLRGRPFRMHLMSPVHALHGKLLTQYVAAADILEKSKEETIPVETIQDSGPKAKQDVGIEAAASGDLDSLKKIVEKNNWNPETVDCHGSTALHWAAGCGHLEVCEYLVDVLQVNPQQPCEKGRADGRQPLHWAARNGQVCCLYSVLQIFEFCLVANYSMAGPAKKSTSGRVHTRWYKCFSLGGMARPLPCCQMAARCWN
eukprot:m.157558 g.157558  ORF g.157558 m.157558 type:complete len:357 (+) comp15120_c0_seq10:279-1349(+)